MIADDVRLELVNKDAPERQDRGLQVFRKLFRGSPDWHLVPGPGGRPGGPSWYSIPTSRVPRPKYFMLLQWVRRQRSANIRDFFRHAPYVIDRAPEYRDLTRRLSRRRPG